MSAWTFQWLYAGTGGEVADVDVRWSERSVLIGESTSSVTLSCVLPVSLADLARRHHPHSGIGMLFHLGQPRVGGNWRGVRWKPLAGGRTQIEVTIGSSAERDLAVFPPVTEFRPNVSQRVDVPGAEPIKLYKADDGRLYGFKPRGYKPTDVTFIRYPRKAISELFPNLADEADGAVWPWVFGAPGSAGSVPATPAYMVKATGTAEIMIAGHSVEADQVTIFGPEAADPASGILTSDVVPVLHKDTSDGRPFAYVSGADLFNVSDASESRYYVAWTHGRATPGGGGELLRRIYEYSTVRVDASAWASVESLLNTYQFDGYFDRWTTPSEVIETQLLPLLPLSVVDGPMGKRPVLFPWATGKRRTGWHLIDGASIVTDDAIEYAADEQAPGSVVVEYGYRPDKSSTRFATSAGVATSGASFTDGEEVITTYAVHDPATASRIAADRLRAIAWAPRVVRATVAAIDEHEIGGARPLSVGQPVSITSTRLGLDREPGTVAEVEREGARMSIAVYLDDDPLEPR